VSAIQSDQFAGLANGMRLHFASAGVRGRPLVLFMHGFPEAWFAWEAQLEFLGAEYYAVAVDLRGFNRSRKPADVEAYRPGKILEDMKLLIAQLGYREAIVVAHDWGGAIAWNLAISLPKLIRKLVIVNAPHPFLFARQLHENPAQQQASGYMNRLRRPGSEIFLAENDFQRLDAVFAAGAAGAPDWYDAPVRARYHAMWSIPGDDATHPLTGAVNYYRASPLHPATPEDPVSVFGGMRAPDWIVHVPVRVIWGLDDTALLPALLDGLGQFCADLSITRLPGASHWVIHERPDEVNALIAQALGEG
jgi:pimeloyl-ACP methyl ester carboxylesterase